VVLVEEVAPQRRRLHRRRRRWWSPEPESGRRRRGGRVVVVGGGMGRVGALGSSESTKCGPTSMGLWPQPLTGPRPVATRVLIKACHRAPVGGPLSPGLLRRAASHRRRASTGWTLSAVEGGVGGLQDVIQEHHPRLVRHQRPRGSPPPPQPLLSLAAPPRQPPARLRYGIMLAV
jgi:hypothetical protein